MDPDRQPAIMRDAFYCPMPGCGVYAAQTWHGVVARGGAILMDYNVSRCGSCGEYSVWRESDLVFPHVRQGEEPHADMPADVMAIYEEARSVSALSRKSAAGLLRLALQMLIDELRPGSGTIDQKIGALVQSGLDPQVQQAMDVLRVVGNESVHPGQIDLDSDDDWLPALFNLTNVVVEQVISRPKMINSLFGKLPQSKRDGIDRRDAGDQRDATP